MLPRQTNRSHADRWPAFPGDRFQLDDSPLYAGAGLYLSTKIDHIRGGNKDDHIIVMADYNAAGAPIQGQAAVQMKNEDSIVTPVITQSQAGSVK